MLQRALPSEDFTWSLIEFGGDHSQVFAGVDAEICSLRKVLADQSILVGPDVKITRMALDQECRHVQSRW